MTLWNIDLSPKIYLPDKIPSSWPSLQTTSLPSLFVHNRLMKVCLERAIISGCNFSALAATCLEYIATGKVKRNLKLIVVTTIAAHQGRPVKSWQFSKILCANWIGLNSDSVVGSVDTLRLHCTVELILPLFTWSPFRWCKFCVAQSTLAHLELLITIHLVKFLEDLWLQCIDGKLPLLSKTGVLCWWVKVLTHIFSLGIPCFRIGVLSAFTKAMACYVILMYWYL